MSGCPPSFGNKVSDDDYYELQNHLSPEKFPDWAGLREREWFRRAQALAREKRFFHWELEFPEAFQGEERGIRCGDRESAVCEAGGFGEIKDYFKLNYQVLSRRCRSLCLFHRTWFVLAQKRWHFSYISCQQMDESKLRRTFEEMDERTTH